MRCSRLATCALLVLGALIFPPIASAEAPCATGLAPTRLAAAPLNHAGGDPDPFNALLLPPITETEIGETVFVRFEVDSTAVEFNGYVVTVRWDPAIVALLDVTQGALMTGACAQQPFFLLRPNPPAPDTVQINHSLLCLDLSIDGPGVLSVLEFEALADGISPIELTSNPDRSFANAGIFIQPATVGRQVVFFDAAIHVGNVTGVAAQPASPQPRLALDVFPNPFNPVTTIAFDLAVPGAARLSVHDARGRRVWTRSWPYLQAGAHTLLWLPENEHGEALPSGTYFARLSTAHTNGLRKLTLLR